MSVETYRISDKLKVLVINKSRLELYAETAMDIIITPLSEEETKDLYTLLKFVVNRDPNAVVPVTY